MDNKRYTVTTSSELSSLHNEAISINEWKKGTFGGWAPADYDTEPWMQASLSYLLKKGELKKRRIKKGRKGSKSVKVIIKVFQRSNGPCKGRSI